ncbi:XRE family transcriptional regulator [Amycolatopsis rubida]|uniref:XRE family transcriptional regulator n=1 Tax=Amycolatopsis rubida TaxID=112413 RepID=A0ABX0BVY7_9PSEU|nr:MULTISPECIES: hypothetical protein [Amycolatopsis]MYW93623.1 XRE family transcriptional regulator [Amycolatopsis rubida]NEC58610.1 XRE family transcriptional regulator [Amycolatopsis rubida]OAP22699.1 hypothetical protein A4R44_06572 [Amycolatopsis sp. M39]
MKRTGTRVPPGADEDLARVLDSGSFAEALRAAVAHRRLTLHELQQRLASAGVRVSATTLSYWTRGRTQPERADSLRAVTLLEDILALPGGSLARLLPPPRPRGPGCRVRVTAGYRQLWEPAETLSQLIEEVGAPDQDRLHIVSGHDRLAIDETGARRRMSLSFVLRAQADRVRRLLVFLHEDEGRPLPQVSVARGGRLGRVRWDGGTGVLVAEVLLDRLLARGETAVVECLLEFAADAPRKSLWERRFGQPMKHYLLEVDFDPAAPPVRCYRTTRDSIQQPARDVGEVEIDSAGHGHLVLLDVPNGCHGLRWEWA